MEIINSINLSEEHFVINFGNSSLKLNFKEENERYIIDLSNYSILEATKIAILASTYCFIKDFKKKLCWLVSDIETYRAINILRLKNIEQRLIQPAINNRMVAI